MTPKFRWNNRPGSDGAARIRYRAIFQAELSERAELGQITTEDYSKALQASERDRVVDKLITESENPEADSGFVGEFSWENIVQWVNDNWVQILRLVLTIFLLFLDGNPDDG